MILIDIGWFSFIRGSQLGHLRFSTLCKFMEVTSGSFVLKTLFKLSIFVLGELFDFVLWFPSCVNVFDGVRPTTTSPP